MNVKSRKITDEDFQRVVRNGVCPVCHDHLIILQHRWGSTNEVTGRRGKFYGKFYVCAGHEDDWRHFSLSPGGGKRRASPHITPDYTKIRM